MSFARFGAIAGVVAMLLGAAASSMADGQAEAVKAASRAHQKEWVRWAFGSNANPFGKPKCGEVKHGDFLLNVAVSKRARFKDCAVPAGSPIIATPGGAVSWRPEDGSLRENVREALSGVRHPKVVVDGTRMHGLHKDLKTTHVYGIHVHRHSTIAHATPEAVPRTQIASGGWWVRIGPLPVGPHELLLRDVDHGKKRSATFEIEVVPD